MFLTDDRPSSCDYSLQVIKREAVEARLRLLTVQSWKLPAIHFAIWIMNASSRGALLLASSQKLSSVTSTRCINKNQILSFAKWIPLAAQVAAFVPNFSFLSTSYKVLNWKKNFFFFLLAMEKKRNISTSENKSWKEKHFPRYNKSMLKFSSSSVLAKSEKWREMKTFSSEKYSSPYLAQFFLLPLLLKY